MSVELKAGVPGLLVTSGIALLAISVLIPTLFPIGITLLLLGVLAYIVKSLFHFLPDDFVEEHEQVLSALYVISMVALAILVVLLFLPLLPPLPGLR